VTSLRIRGLVLSLALAACHHTPKPVSVAPLPAGAYAHYLAGKYALYRDDADRAVIELTAASKAAPEQPMITVELARALAKAKQQPAAREVLAKARTAWPDHAIVWLASGEVLEKDATLRPGAMDAYRHAIRLDPTDERAYLGLARTQLAAGDTAGAEKTLRGLVGKLPESVDGHYRLAQRLEANGNREAAVGELRAVLERDPDHLDARIDLARTLRRLGKLAEAVEQTRSAFDRAGQPMDIAEELFYLLCEADDRQSAIDLMTLLDDDRSDADALATVAHWNRALGRMAEARDVATRIKALDPDASTIAIAETDLAEGKVEAGLAGALSVPETSPRYVQARRVAIDFHLKAKHGAEALALITPLRAVKPADLELLYLEAMAQASGGDVAQAKALSAQITGADAIVVALARARIAEALGDQTGALAVLEPALRGSPDHVGALNLAGYLLATRKERLPDAERYLARARDLQPGDPSVLDSWGFLLVQRGRSRDAVRALGHAARFSTREPEILFHLATAWAADGAPRMAAEVLDRASSLGPQPDLQGRIDALRNSLGLR
jgi:tetratricopeptide (TPR) repeat protein